VEIAHAAERGRAGFRRWLGAVISVGCQIRIVGSVQFPPGTRIKSLRTPKKAVFDPKLMVGGGYHEVVFDESGFLGDCVGVDWGLIFLCI